MSPGDPLLNDDDYSVFPRTMMVHPDDDDDKHTETGILGPDGQPIYVVEISEHQGFIGFLRPSWATDRSKQHEGEDE